MKRSRFKFGKNGPCPCGKSNKFTPVTDIDCEGGGKCWSSKCGQQFFPPKHSQDIARALYPSTSRDHIYEDEDGRPLIKVSVERTDDGQKHVTTSHLEDHQWTMGLGSIRRVPYRLPQTLEAIRAGKPILVVEGEKDCDTAFEKGLVATTNLFGAKKWRDEYSRLLHGVVAVIISDNDEIGREHGQLVDQSLASNNASKVVHLDLLSIMPDLPAKGDLSDYFQRGGTVVELTTEIERLLADDACENDASLSSGIPLPQVDIEILPSLLRELVAPLQDANERIALLFAAMVSLGSIMPGVQAMYNGNAIAPMLYLFLVGAAGSGKSVILPARTLVAGVEAMHREYNRDKSEEFRLQQRQWIREGKKRGEPCPRDPEYRTLLLPPDATAPVTIRSLSVNRSLLLFDTEADSLKAGFSAKNGDVSAALRKAFHHEPISQARVGNSLVVHCDRPNLAIVISGTPDQILPLVQGAQNGLASRFAFVQLHRRARFKDPFDSATSLPTEIAHAKAHIVTRLYNLLLDSSYMVSLTPDQQRIFRDFFTEGYETNSDDIDSAVTLRSAVVVIRLCIILAVLHCYEEYDHVHSSMIVSDADFGTAMNLGAYLRLSSGDIVDRLRSMNHDSFPRGRRSREDEFFASLPEKFTTAEAKRVGQDLSLSSATIQRYLTEGKYCQRRGHGRYINTKNRAS